MAGQLVAIQAFDSNGVPVAGAKFKTEAAGTTTPKAAYADEAGTVALSNPVTTNAAGIAACWLKSGIGDYKISLTDPTGSVFLFRTIDNYTPATDSILYIIGSDIETARTEALDAATAAELAQSLAETAQANAETAEQNAENAQTGAESAQAAAAASAATATTQAGIATTQAGIATTQAGLAATARTGAETAETNAETAQAAAEAAQAFTQAYADADIDEPVEGQGIITFNPATVINLGTNVFTIVGNTLAEDFPVTYRNGGGTAPAGLTTNTQYWIVNKVGNDFALSAARGGSPVDITTVGTGTTHELLPVRSAKHAEFYARLSEIEARASEVSTIEAALIAQELIKPGSYANAGAVVAAFPADLAPYFFKLSTGQLHVLIDESPPTSIEYQILAKSNTAENQAGVDDTKFVTPKGAREVVQSTPQSKVIMPPLAALAPDAVGGDLVSFSDAGAAAETANEYKKAGVFFHTGDRLKKVWHAGFADVAEHFGAVGDNVQDNLQNFLDAWTAAKAAGHKTVYIPPARGAGFLLSGSMFTIDVDEAMVFGVGRASILRFTNDGAGLRIDCSGAASRQRIHLRNFHMVNDHATGAASVGVDIVTDVAKLQGLLHSRFEGLWFRRFGLANVRFGNTAAEALGVGSHAFCEIINQKDPNTDRYPDYSIYCVQRGGSTINISGGMLRAKNATETAGDATKGYCIKAGANIAGVGFGDMKVTDVQFTRARSAVFIEGAPRPGTGEYRSGVSLHGCDFDGLDDFTYRLHRMDNPVTLSNSNQTGVNAELIDCTKDRALVKTKSYIELYGLRVDAPATVGADPDFGVGVALSETGNPAVAPVQYDSAASPNARLDVKGLGTGGVEIGHNQANYVLLSGAANGLPATITTEGDSDANVGLNFNMKGTGRLSLCVQPTELLAFFNHAGSARQTLAVDGFSPDTIDALLTALANHGLFTYTPSYSKANKIIQLNGADFKELTGAAVTFTSGSPATLETIVKATSVVIPKTDVYDIRIACCIRHRDSAASDYDVRFQTAAPGAADSAFTGLGPHFKTAYEGSGSTDDHQHFVSMAVEIAAGTYDFRLAGRQITFTTTGGQALVNSASQATFFQIVRL